ncbi:MAG: hypothetical protein K1X81_09790, partial [Bacteroidia bacterium]|nr:hypothetical protein [Bacteroidia bacterium]
VTDRVHVEITGWARAPFIDFKTNGTNSPIALLESWKTKLTGMKTGDYVDIEKVTHLPMREWLPIWFQRLNVVNLALVLFTLLTGVFLAVTCVLRKKEMATMFTGHALPLSVYGVIVSGLLFWFVTAPDLRFSHGVILPFIGVNLSAGSYLWKQQAGKQQAAKVILFLLLPVLLAGNYTYFKSFYPAGLMKDTFIQPLHYMRPVLTDKPVPGGVVRVAAYPQKCWDSELPCTCIFYEGLQYRGQTMDDGFVIK